jgi:hypothetical protein
MFGGFCSYYSHPLEFKYIQSEYLNIKFRLPGPEYMEYVYWKVRIHQFKCSEASVHTIRVRIHSIRISEHQNRSNFGFQGRHTWNIYIGRSEYINLNVRRLPFILFTSIGVRIHSIRISEHQNTSNFGFQGRNTWNTYTGRSEYINLNVRRLPFILFTSIGVQIHSIRISEHPISASRAGIHGICILEGPNTSM